MSSATKLIVIIGITGNQGGSVAKAFLQDSAWKIRGLSRNVESPASQAYKKQGVEMIQANLNDPESLVRAFTGANLIFSVTDFWQFFFEPEHREKAKAKGMQQGRYAYECELQQGRNIADAAATASVLATLDTPIGFIASTISSARTCSQGKMQELWHFDSKADAFPTYVTGKHPKLVARMSYVQTGVFMSSWKYAPDLWFGWNEHQKSYEMKASTPTHAKLPHLDVRRDTGLFVKALLQLPVGSVVMAAGVWATWSEYMQAWENATGNKAMYTQITTAEMDEMIPGGFGKELGDMWEYSGDPGYDGGDKNVLRLDDLEKMGISFPTTSLEDYMSKEDYSMVFDAAKHKQ